MTTIAYRDGVIATDELTVHTACKRDIHTGGRVNHKKA